MVLGNVLFGRSQICRRTVAQDLQPEARFAADGTEGYGDGQTYHAARPRNTYAHGIFQDIGAQAQMDVLGTLAQQFSRTCYAESHSHRFGTTDGRYYFAVEQIENFFPFLIV